MSLLCDVIHDKRLNSANETTVSKAYSQHKDVWVPALSSARKSGVFCLHSQTPFLPGDVFQLLGSVTCMQTDL